MDDPEILGAFSERDAARLTGVSVGQLRSWDRSGFLVPSYAPDNRRQPFSRIYSFRDVVSLRVLNSLRNEHRVSLQHLRQVSRALAHLGDARWTAQTLYVLGRRVVFDDPRPSERREVVSRQRVFDIPLRVAIKDTREAVRRLNVRSEGVLGHVVSQRFVMNNRPVFEGTRIPVSSVVSYLQRGHDAATVLREFPELRHEDIKAARAQMGDSAA